MKRLWKWFFGERKQQLDTPVIISNLRRRYFFDGNFWYKKDDGMGIEQINETQIKVMKKNTIEGQWVLNGHFQDRTDIRTWITEKKWI